jgi:hypothetical protein
MGTYDQRAMHRDSLVEPTPCPYLAVREDNSARTDRPMRFELEQWNDLSDEGVDKE